MVLEFMTRDGERIASPFVVKNPLAPKNGVAMVSTPGTLG